MLSSTNSGVQALCQTPFSSPFHPDDKDRGEILSFTTHHEHRPHIKHKSSYYDSEELLKITTLKCEPTAGTFAGGYGYDGMS